MAGPLVVYILTNHTGTLYTGVTGNLPRRMLEHRTRAVPGFTARYNIKKLLYAEQIADPRAAIQREKQIKGWTRAKKLALIQKVNPEMKDLVHDWL